MFILKKFIVYFGFLRGKIGAVTHIAKAKCARHGFLLASQLDEKMYLVAKRKMFLFVIWFDFIELFFLEKSAGTFVNPS